MNRSKREDYKRFVVFCLASLIIIAQTAIFAYVWYDFYSSLILKPFWRKGNWVLILIYALIYLMIGYVNGLFSETYFDEDIKLPLLLIAGSEFVYGLLIYFLMFMLRGEFDFVYYLMHVIIPELIYTVGVTLILYQLILWINQKLEAESKKCFIVS